MVELTGNTLKGFLNDPVTARLCTSANDRLTCGRLTCSRLRCSTATEDENKYHEQIMFIIKSTKSMNHFTSMMNLSARVHNPPSHSPRRLSHKCKQNLSHSEGSSLITERSRASWEIEELLSKTKKDNNLLDYTYKLFASFPFFLLQCFFPLSNWCFCFTLRKFWHFLVRGQGFRILGVCTWTSEMFVLCLNPIKPLSSPGKLSHTN